MLLLLHSWGSVAISTLLFIIDNGKLSHIARREGPNEDFSQFERTFTKGSGGEPIT